jgi:hypothetical protein
MNVLTISKDNGQITVTNKDENGILIHSHTIRENLISAQDIIDLLKYKPNVKYQINNSETEDQQLKPFIEFFNKLITRVNQLTFEQD